ncbi:Carboxylic ester hydrolase [Sergentomyia squamirostris]
MQISSEFVVYLLFVLLCFTACQSNYQKECKFQIQQNRIFIQGIGLFSRGFCHFLSIPYAKPPTLLHQFRSPQTIDLHNGVKFWNFTEKSSTCVQTNFDENTLAGSEDCLYLNVFRKPWTDEKILQPVAVWIHGGTFNFGSAYTDLAEYPEQLIAENITVVTLNYRLGALGFLYRDNEDIAENSGLKDQQEALRWIQRNIAFFGGDSTSVTIMGWSAGSAAVSYHLYDHQSEGLFHAAIMMSGSFLNPWAYSPSPDICLNTLCEQLDISCGNYGHLKATLMDVEIEKNLPLLTVISFFGLRYPCFVPTGPPPHTLIKEKPPIDVPLMIGFTAHETIKQIEFDYSDVVYSNYNFPHPHQLTAIEDFLRNSVSESNRTEILVFGDLIYGVIKFTEEYAQRTKADTFLYKFNLNGGFHGDDLPLIFKNINSDGVKMNEKHDIGKVDDKVIRLWTNFIKFGNPTPLNDPTFNTLWTPYDAYKKRDYLNIGQPFKMETLQNDTPFTIWDGIYECLYYGNCSHAPN